MEEPVCGCRDGITDYIAWHVDALHRAARGQRQRFCLRCRRWRWPDLLGAGAEPVDKNPEEAQNGRAR